MNICQVLLSTSHLCLFALSHCLCFSLKVCAHREVCCLASQFASFANKKKLDTLSINQANTQTLHLIRWTCCCGISKMCVLKTFKVRNRQYVAKSVFILTLFIEFHKFPEASCLTVLTLDKWTQLQGGHSCLGTLCQFVTVCPQISPASPAFLHLFPGPGVFLICPLFLYYSLVFFSSAIFILWPAFTLLLL